MAIPLARYANLYHQAEEQRRLVELGVRANALARLRDLSRVYGMLAYAQESWGLEKRFFVPPTPIERSFDDLTHVYDDLCGLVTNGPHLYAFRGPTPTRAELEQARTDFANSSELREIGAETVAARQSIKERSYLKRNAAQPISE